MAEIDFTLDARRNLKGGSAIENYIGQVAEQIDAAPKMDSYFLMNETSMSPTIKIDDLAIVDRNVRSWIGDGIYLITFPNGMEQLRRMVKILSKDDLYHLTFDNPVCKGFNEYVSGEDINIAGRIVGSFSHQKL